MSQTTYSYAEYGWRGGGLTSSVSGVPAGNVSYEAETPDAAFDTCSTPPFNERYAYRQKSEVQALTLGIVFPVGTVTAPSRADTLMPRETTASGNRTGLRRQGSSGISNMMVQQIRLATLGLLLFPLAALASHHSFYSHDLYSNADGTVQYVELISDADGHGVVSCCNVVATNTATGVTRIYGPINNFPSNTNSRSVLMGTATVEAAFGMQPDFILPDGFITTTAGSVRYNTTLS